MRWLAIVLLSLSSVLTAQAQTTTSTTAPPLCQRIGDEDCIVIHPIGIGAGTGPKRGCLDWAEDALSGLGCWYTDYNCNGVQEDPPECCLGCGGGTTTTSTTSTTSTSTTTTSSTSTTVAGPTTSTTTTTSTSSTSTTSTSTSTTSTSTSTSTSTTSSTIAAEAFAIEFCYHLGGARPEHDNHQPWIAPGAQTVTQIGCHCEGECISPIATIQVADSSGNVISTTSPVVCSTIDAATTFQDTDPLDADRNLVEGERLAFSVSNSPGSYDRVMACVRFE